MLSFGSICWVRIWLITAGLCAEAIVDPHFAEQFAVARSTPRYASILDALPDAYVGTDIKPVVEFLCGELVAAFEVKLPFVQYVLRRKSC